MGEEISNQPAVDKVTKYYSMRVKAFPIKHLAVFMHISAVERYFVILKIILY